MMKASEPEIRELLHQRARQFSMAQQLPPAILRRAHRKRSRTVMLTGAVVLAIGALGAVALRPAPAADPGDRAAVGGASRSMPTRALKSVSYVLADPTTGGEETHPHINDGPTVTVKELREHARCMRAQGLDIPDPTRTSQGWAVRVDPGAVDLGSSRLREAMFVTCGPLGGPLTGDLVLSGLSQPQIDRFLACMRGQGFNVPRPRRQPGGDSLFDLRRTGIDTSRPAWNRALFVTCSPRLP